MLKFSDVETFLTTGLAGLGYSATNPAISADQKPMPFIGLGPIALPSQANLAPGAMVLAEVGNGAGLTLEQTYDQVFITVRVVGPQYDYDTAEALAYDVDRLMLAVNSPGIVGSTRVLFINRTGGAPQLVDLDASDRYHFQTTYITPASTGL